MVNNGMRIARQIDIDLENEVTKPRGFATITLFTVTFTHISVL